MNIGYLRLDHGEWTQGSYNSQEIGLAKAFAKIGHHVTIFYCVYPHDDKLGTEVKVNDNIRKCYLPAKSFGHHALLEMKELDKYSIDLLHIQGDNLLRVPEAVKYCKKRGIKYYCYVGRIDSEKTGKLHRLLADIMVRRNIYTYRNNLVFVKTPAVKKQLESYGAKNVKLAPVGLDLSIIPKIRKSRQELRAELNLPAEKKIVLCVCGLRPGKQPYDIFKLARVLDNSYFFAFIGGWDQEAEDSFRNKINQEGLKDRFRYKNKIPNVEIHKYYKAADFFVNFNQHEIFGMAVLEAMYQGLTVIARRAPGPEFIIENGKSGYLADTIDEMADFITNGYKTEIVGRERVVKDFSWDATAKIMLGETYEK